jgi:hypothetical protein
MHGCARPRTSNGKRLNSDNDLSSEETRLSLRTEFAQTNPFRPLCSGVLAMIIKTYLLSLPFALLIGAAAAQTPSWPIVNGRQLQPTQQQIDSKKSDKARQWDRDVQPDIDRLYEKLTNEAPALRR